MTSRGLIAVTTILLFFVLGILNPAPTVLGSQVSRDCCSRYSRRPVPFQHIMGYIEQTIKENCRIEAIIFYTVKNIEVCATRKDKWVRRTLELLSLKLKKMSKGTSAARETPIRKPGTLSVRDGSRSVFATTEAFPNNTDSFY
ncbi:C-C motif chemokine 19-like [Brachyistius frenatus]|uniref:C-C motif chemokine 19-like n=1 Tax=Brachyistius frenatus TaxID=100188 RepID=UPI0037E9687B